MTPTVSVVIPTYRRPEYLVEALGSLIGQAYRDFEAIVGNDGGLDYITPVKAKFSDERIRWVDHPARKGMFGNILDCFGRARGRYVATLHDDDRWDPRFLEMLVPPLEQDRSISVAFSDHHVIDEHGEVDAELSDAFTRATGRARLRRGVHRPIYEMVLIDRGLAMNVSAVFRRDRLGLSTFPTQAGVAYDLWLGRQMARGGAGAWYEPTRLAFYRQHPSSETSARTLDNARANIYLYQRFLADPELAVVRRDALRRRLAHHRYSLAVGLIRADRPRAARRELVRSLADGGPPRAGLALGATLLPAHVRRRL